MIKKTKIEKWFKKGTLIVRDFSQDGNAYNYINVSINNNSGVDAVTLVVRDWPDESDLLPRRHPGSIPGRSAPTFSNLIKLNVLKFLR